MRPSVLLVALLAACSSRAVALATGDADQTLRHRPPGAPATSPGPPILIIALDGMNRDLLYDMLRAGDLPRLEEVLGGDRLAHAYMDDHLLSTLPSTTMPAWVSAMTGVTPAEHGVTGSAVPGRPIVARGGSRRATPKMSCRRPRRCFAPTATAR